MKKLILFLFFMLPMVVNAQRIDKPGEPYEFFCEVKCDASGFVAISFQNKSDWYRQLYNEDGKRLSWKSPTQAINYMTKRGWKYVECINEKSYLFKKTVSSDEQAMEFFLFSDTKK